MKLYFWRNNRSWWVWEAMQSTPAPPSSASVASVWGLSSPPACGGPFLSSCTSLFPGSQASLCIHPSPVHTFARGNLFFRSWEVIFPRNLLVSEWVFFSINSNIFISWTASWATMTLLSLAYSFANILFLDSYCYDFVVLLSKCKSYEINRVIFMIFNN